MPFHNLRVPQPYARLIYALLAGLLPIVLGLTLSVLQAASELKQDAGERLLDAQRMFDRMLDNADLAASAVVESAGRPCLKVLQGLRAQVTTLPDVRSVNLVKGSTIYCTSLYGPYQGEINPADYILGRLDIRKGNPGTPMRPLIVYRQLVGENSILVGIDGYYLLNILDMLSRRSPLGVVVGAQMLKPDGQLTDQLLSAEEHGYLEQASAKYPFKVVSNLSTDEYFAHVWDYSKASLLVYLLFSLLFGLWVFWLMGRSTLPKS